MEYSHVVVYGADWADVTCKEVLCTFMGPRHGSGEAFHSNWV
jgi:hypothetical protein